MAILWDEIAPRLKEADHAHSHSFLTELFSDDSLLDLIVRFKSRVARECAFRLASHLRSESVPELVTMCLSYLQKMNDESNFGTIIECLFAWNCSSQVVGSILQLISAPIKSKTGRKKARTSKSREDAEDADQNDQNAPSKALTGLKILNYIMVIIFQKFRWSAFSFLLEKARETLRRAALEHGELVTQILQQLLQYFTLIEKSFDDPDFIPVDLLKMALLSYSKLYIHASAAFEDIEKDCVAISELVSWVNDVFLPIL